MELYSLGAHAQTTSRATVTQFTDWFSATSNMKLTGKFALFVDPHMRFVNGTEPAQYLLRVGGDFKISKSLFIMPLGYAYIGNYQYGEQPVAVANDEHRIFQQVSYFHKLKGATLWHRLRTEERFIQSHQMDTNGEWVNQGFDNNIQYRLRYRISATIPITKQQDPTLFAMDPKSWYLFIFEELFLSRGEKVTYHEIDQNRIFVGVGYQFTKDFTIQTGPYWQILVKANGAQQENNVGIGTWLIYNFDFTKKP